MFKKARKWVIFLTLLSVLIVFFFPSEKVIELGCADKLGKTGRDRCEISIVEASKNEKHDQARKYIEIGANHGNPKMQLALGLLYESGDLGQEKNEQKALYWIEKSAKQDYAQGQRELGRLYKKRGDYTKAFELYKKSAEQGYVLAQVDVGFMYAKGEGVQQNYIQANQWFYKAAEQGNAQAQYNLGVSYDRGRGVEQNYKIAFQWYKKAAEQEYADAQHNIGVMYEYGEGVEKNLTKAKEYYQKAYNYYQKACINGVGAEKSCERLKELSNSIKRL